MLTPSSGLSFLALPFWAGVMFAGLRASSSRGRSDLEDTTSPPLTASTYMTRLWFSIGLLFLDDTDSFFVHGLGSSRLAVYTVGWPSITFGHFIVLRHPLCANAIRVFLSMMIPMLYFMQCSDLG